MELMSAALGQEGVSKLSSYVSTKLEDRASRAHLAARGEEALFRLDHALERTGKMPITYVSLLRRRQVLLQAYIEGTQLLNKHKPSRVLEGNQEAGQVRSSSYLERILSAATTSLSAASSLFGFNKEHYLSSSDVGRLEWFADCAEKFVEKVESSCPLRRDITFRYPFIRQLLEGKSLSYHRRMEGSHELWLDIDPMVSEGRGVEASIMYRYDDFERQDNNLELRIMLRLSESTDIVGIATNCLHSSASLLHNLVAEDATGQLPLLHNLQDISASYGPPGDGSQETNALLARCLRPDPVCCHPNQHNPGAKAIISSELSHILPEQVITFYVGCYITAAEYSPPRASDKPGRVRHFIMIDRPPPPKVSLSITPHFYSARKECYISKEMGSNEDISTYGSIQETIDTLRLEAIDCLTRQPEVDNCVVSWWAKHGYASLSVNKSITSGSRYNTRGGGAKRKR